MAPPLRWTDLTTLVTPGGTLTHNALTGDTYFVDPDRSVGLGSGEVRNPTDDKAQTDGFIVHPRFEKGAVLVPAGVILARSDTTGVTGANALMTAMLAALRSIKSVPGTMNFANGAALSVYWNLLVGFPALGGDLKGFVYGVVSASPPPA